MNEFVLQFLSGFWKVPMYDIEAQRKFVEEAVRKKDERIAELEKDLEVAMGCVDPDEYNEAWRKSRE